MDYTWDIYLVAGLKALSALWVLGFFLSMSACAPAKANEPGPTLGAINAKSCKPYLGLEIPKWVAVELNPPYSSYVTNLMECEAITGLGTNCGTGRYLGEVVYGCLESE